MPQGPAPLARRRRRARRCCRSRCSPLGLDADARDRRGRSSPSPAWPQHPGRLHRPRLVRPRRLVRARAPMRRRSRSATGSRRLRPAGAVRARLRARRRGARRLPDPAPARRLLLAADAGARRRMLYAVAFRWTEFTGGENGLGGVMRPIVLGVDLEPRLAYYVARGGGRLPRRAALLWRFHRSPVGSVLVAIRENEQRARFIGYPTNRYKLARLRGLGDASPASPACCSCSTTASPRPTRSRVAFSGELLAMVVIGGMRSFLGPALGRAVLHPVPRIPVDLDRRTGCSASACCSSASSCSRRPASSASPSGCCAPFRQGRVEEAAMAAARDRATSRCRPSCSPPSACDGADPRGARASPSASAASRPCRASTSRCADRTLHALIGPNGAGKTTAFNLISGMFAPGRGHGRLLAGRSIAGLAPETIARPASAARSRSPTCSRRCRSRRTCASPCRRATRSRFDPGATRAPSPTIERRDRRADALPRARRHRAGRGRRAVLRRPAAARHGRWRSPRGRACCCSTSRSPGSPPPSASASATSSSASRPTCRCCWSSTTSTACSSSPTRVTVMNEGTVLVDGTVEDARSSPQVQEVYIGSGTAALAAKPRESAAEPATLLTLEARQHLLRQEPHPARRRPSTCTSTRSSRCSAATAPASRRC